MDEEISDWREIRFPRRIGQKEARTLCRHLVFSLEGNCYVQLNTKRSEQFGDRFLDKTPTSPEEVPLISSGSKLSGVIQRTSDISSVEFNFEQDYDKRGRIGYKGMDLAVGLYDWNEMDESNRALVTDVRSAVQGYFQGKR